MGMENGHFEHFRLMSQKWPDVTEMLAKVTWSEIAVGWGRQYQCTVPCANGWLHRQLDDKASRCCRWWVVLPREDEVTLRYGYLYWKFSLGLNGGVYLLTKCQIPPFNANANLKDYPANTKYLYNICTMLDQRRRRWADVVQMLYRCFVFAGILDNLFRAATTETLLITDEFGVKRHHITSNSIFNNIF